MTWVRFYVWREESEKRVSTMTSKRVHQEYLETIVPELNASEERPNSVRSSWMILEKIL